MELTDHAGYNATGEVAETESGIMSFAPTPDQSGVQTALRSFLLDVIPAGHD
jgi:hypothetical protein